MPSGQQTKRQIRQKRHTWPRTSVNTLEPIIESPRTPTKPKFPAGSDGTSQGSPRGTTDLNHSQLLWYSQVLAESQKERLKLGDKILHLERVCEKQKSKNARLQEEVYQWQANFDTIRVELFDAVQEIEDARSYVRSIETSNANLKYVLAQIKEQEQAARERKWSKRIKNFVQSVFKSKPSRPNSEKLEALSVARAKTPEPFATAKSSKSQRSTTPG